MINMRNLRAYSSFPSVYHLLNSGEWMESYKQWMETCEQKKARQKQSEVQVDMLRSSGSSRGAFSKNLFCDRGRTNDPAVFEITWKRLRIRENHQHEKSFAFSLAFQRYIICPIPIKFVEIMAKIRFSLFSKLT